MPEKPLGRKAYGSIGHLPNSRRGPADHGLDPGQGRICTERVRDKHDVVIVQEKLDGSNVAVARVKGQFMALGRAGWPARSSRYEQHQWFAVWVQRNEARFDFLGEGQWLSGEWLAQAHGTRYDLTGREPFVAFDWFQDGKRTPFDEFTRTCASRFVLPKQLHGGKALSVAAALTLLGEFGHYGALDPAEGVVYRVERKGKVDFLAKYVRPDKVDGLYLPEISGKDAVWNWRP
ncbi:MAG: RNA ligase family protein [Candidatus Hydrogenedentes bacterium]|nr:RNA ligase family protein [Candidatus Hydrogenedentota bacterium]MBI3119362.1 RNA ligase family protein [Candidatus Hydrogenedentota bacterium]